MRNAALFGLMMAGLCTDVMAQATSGTTLWGQVENGMTRSQVEALYPKQKGKIKHRKKQTEIEDVVILEGCEAEVEIQYENDVVDVVKVKGRGSIAGRCSDKVFAALGAKYGQPDVQRRSRGSIVETEGDIAVWNREGVTLRFKRRTNGIFGGGGLGTASWEAWYTASAQEINL